MISTLLIVAATLAVPQADVLVICPEALRAEMLPWARHRAAQGHEIVWLAPAAGAAQLRQQILSAAKQHPLQFVVLVGDVPAPQSRSGTPTHFIEAKINRRWGSEPEIATDHPYADLDGDHLPDVAIGRLPADSPAELRLLVEKILAYETNTDFGEWRRRVNFVAGLGGFGALADAALEAAAKKLITDGIPASYATSMTYGSWRSPYCPDPRSFRNVTLDRLNEGCLFWVYIGHGDRTHVDYLRVPGGLFPILSDQDTDSLHAQSGAPIACFLACYTGAYDGRRDCLAEEMLLADRGPVAVYAGSRVTMPYAMSVMGMSMLETTFAKDAPATLGESVLKTKRRMMATEGLSSNRRALDGLAALVSPAPVDLVAERREHLYLFNLLGDPLLRLPVAQQVEITTAATATPGSELEISGTSTIAGDAIIELVVRRDRTTFTPAVRKEFLADEVFLTQCSEDYLKANNHCLATESCNIEPGQFHCTLRIPDDAKGVCHVRAFVRGKESCALGHCSVEVAP